MTSHKNIIISTCEVQKQPTKEEVLSILDNYYNKKDEYKRDRGSLSNWQTEIEDEAGDIFYKVLDYERKIRNDEWASLEEGSSFKKNNPQSIIWEVLNILSVAYIDQLFPDDLPHLRKFLLTPAGKELEGWEEWEAYWNSRHPPKE